MICKSDSKKPHLDRGFQVFRTIGLVSYAERASQYTEGENRQWDVKAGICY